MNLAAKDIRHNFGRFALTAAGIGLLLMTVLGMSGIYRGMIGWVFPRFPRRVLIAPEDLWGLAFVVVIISVLASLLGIWKALRVEPNKVLSQP